MSLQHKIKPFLVILLILKSLVISSMVQAADALAVNILLLTGEDSDYSMHQAGAELGIKEGNIQGQFLGIDYQLSVQDVGSSLNVDLTNLPTAVIVAGSTELLEQIQSVFNPLDVAVFNIALSDNSLRTACLPGVFHTPPSEKMLADAVAQWQQQSPGARVEASAWHQDFVKFAGRDLNRRFREEFGKAMDNDAWAGWAATRGLAEAVVRTMSDAPVVVSDYIRNELAFDGQKGLAQSYRASGQLRQPLLISEQGRLLGEAPVRGVAEYTDLDSLGVLTCE